MLPPVTNVQDTLYATIKSLVTSDAVTALLGGTGGYHWQDEPNAGGLRRDQVNVTDAHYPQITMSCTAMSSTPTIVTFGRNVPQADYRRNKKYDVDFVMTVTFAALTNTDQTPLESTIEYQLDAPGDCLGVPWVGLARWRKQRENKTVAGQTRTVVTYTISCTNCRPRLAANP